MKAKQTQNNVSLRLRRPKANNPAKAGSQTAAVMAVDGTAAVLIVSMLLTAAPDEFNEMDDEAKVQEKNFGRAPQEKFTGPVNPPCGVTVTVAVPVPANSMERLLGFTAVVNPGLEIVSVKGCEVLPVKFVSPP
jgi:hypothetical protein